MSATFFLKHRDLYVRLTFIAGKSVYELVDRSHATPFISEADAWLAVHQHRMNVQWCEVVDAAGRSLTQSFFGKRTEKSADAGTGDCSATTHNSPLEAKP